MRQEVLPIHRDTVGEKSEDYIYALNGLGIIHLERYERDDALSRLLEALDLAEYLDLEVATRYESFIVANIAMVHHTFAEYDEAAPLLERALDLSAKTVGKDHTEYATVLINIAANDWHRDAVHELTIERAQIGLQIRTSILGLSNPDTQDAKILYERLHSGETNTASSSGPE